MSQRPLPEAIRGSWYYVLDDLDPHQGLGKSAQLLSFRVDGSFSRYQLKEHLKKEVESGDYTFDGHFLIIRGRNTDTFRVHHDAFWKWVLEGKKDDYKMIRGLIDEDDFIELSAEDQKEIRILPLRVGVQSKYEGADVIHDLVYAPADRDPIAVGSFFVERHEDGRLWIGLTRLAAGLEKKTWERIIRDSFLDYHMSKPQDVGVVTVRFLDSNDAVVFNYAT